MRVETVSFRGFQDINLVADVRGDTDDWPVMFLHGGGQTRHAWGATAEAVASRGWRTVVVDLRGHGDSEWSSNGVYSFESFSEDCVAIARQLQKPPVVVGASLGGIAAMLAEGTAPETMTSGLVLVDITPKTNLKGIERIRSFMDSGIRGFDSLEEAADAIAAYTLQRPRKYNPSGLKKVLRHRDDKWYWHWDPRMLGQTRIEVETREYHDLLERALGNIHVPTLLVRGASSDVVTDEGVDDFLVRLPGATAIEVPSAGHMIAGDQNTAFSDAVINFLHDAVRPTIEA